jgi:MFS family permease
MRLLTTLKHISSTTYLVAFITFCMRAGQFMSMPFLAIYLAKAGFLTSSQIGLVLGISGLFLSLTGFINGMYVDRHSYRKTLIVSLVLAGLCYFGFAVSINLFYGLLLLNAALGWFRSFAEISAISILISNTRSDDLSFAYSVRFIGANLGVALGPLIGALMAVHHSLVIFYIAGIVNIGLAVMVFLYKEPTRIIDPNKAKINLLASLKLIFQDKMLLVITFINFILWTVYSQLDTTLPLYLAHTWPNPAKLFSILIVVNTMICVFFQALVLRWAELTSLRMFGMLGGGLFAGSMFLIGFFPTQPMIFLSVIMMSVAELCTLPINSLLIMRVAPKHLIASYNGLLSLGLLGLSIGPALGGYGLDLLGGQRVFILIGCLPLIVIWFYYRYVND